MRLGRSIFGGAGNPAARLFAHCSAKCLGDGLMSGSKIPTIGLPGSLDLPDECNEFEIHGSTSVDRIARPGDQPAISAFRASGKISSTTG